MENRDTVHASTCKYCRHEELLPRTKDSGVTMQCINLARAANDIPVRMCSSFTPKLEMGLVKWYSFVSRSNQMRLLLCV